MKCEFCGEEIKEGYLKADLYFFDEYAIDFEQGVFCDQKCFIGELVECGAIEDADLRS